MHADTPQTPSADHADATRLISSHRLPLPATFRFASYDARFDAAVARDDGSGAKLVVRCNVGYLPYSAESLTARRRLYAVIEAGTNLPFAEITLDRTQTIVILGTMSFAALPSPAIVAAGTAVIAIGMKPILDIVTASRETPKRARRGPGPVN